MKREKLWTAIAIPLLAASATLATAPAATAAPTDTAKKGTFTCKQYGYGGKTNARTPVHVTPNGSATITGYIAKGTTVHLYYECINSAGNIWYELTGNPDNWSNDGGRFIYSGYL